jgi:glutaredoxin 3
MNAKAFLIYTQPNCKWCVLAKGLLDDMGWFWAEVDVTKDAQAKARLKDLGLKTVPQIWFGEEHIGGFSNLEVWVQARKANGHG